MNIDDEIDQVSYKHIEDALALKGDERRGTLRYAAGSCDQTLIRRFLNGETRPFGVIN